MPEADTLIKKSESLRREVSTIAVAVRGHLLIDSLLDQLLICSLPTDYELELKKLSVTAKVDLCRALGTLPDMLKPLLVLLNSVRNKYAHEEDYELSNQDVLVIAQMTRELLQNNSRMLEIFQLDKKENTSLEVLKNSYMAVSTLVYVQLEHALKSRVMNEVMNEEVRHLAQELIRTNPALGKKSERDQSRESQVSQILVDRWRKLWGGENQ